jgi:hypothetical protein
VRLAVPIERTDWRVGPGPNAAVKMTDVVIPAGSLVAVERVLPTVSDEVTGQPTARVLLRVSSAPAAPVFWHSVVLCPDDKATLLALGLRFVRPSVTW